MKSNTNLHTSYCRQLYFQCSETFLTHLEIQPHIYYIRNDGYRKQRVMENYSYFIKIQCLSRADDRIGVGSYGVTCFEKGDLFCNQMGDSWRLGVSLGIGFLRNGDRLVRYILRKQYIIKNKRYHCVNAVYRLVGITSSL